MNLIKRLLLCCLIIVCAVLIYSCRSVVDINKTSNNTPANDTAAAPVTSHNYIAKGQVRNNKIEVEKNSLLKLFWKDPVFKNFKDTGKNYEEYEKWLFDEAKAKGIDEEKLRKSLSAAMTLKDNDTIVYPVVIETGKFNGKDCFIFIFTWEFKNSVEVSDTVKPLGHIFITAMEVDTQKVIAEESCM